MFDAANLSNTAEGTVINFVNKFVNFVKFNRYKMMMTSTTRNIKAKYLWGFACLFLSAGICLAFSLTGNDDFDLAKQEILLRKIGHEILLHSGDSTSRVLPVSRTGEREYQIKFENEFTFQPDSLVKIVRRSLAKDALADNYIVNVLNCTGKGVIFGYAIFKDEHDNVIPCSGRKQPKSCYMVNIKFQSSGITPIQKGYLIGGLPLLAFIGLIVVRSVNGRKITIAPIGTSHHVEIGNTMFDPAKRQIIIAGIVTELTAKENKLLLILASPPNVTIERSRLQKEIWEDEGVIVGRSLDVFVSKLRKKLERDITVQLVNIHGKGYILKIVSA